MQPKYEKALFPRFRDDLNKRSKNVVFKYTTMIIEEKYPELHEEVKYLIDRNVEKEALLKKVGSSWYQYNKRKISKGII